MIQSGEKKSTKESKNKEKTSSVIKSSSGKESQRGSSIIGQQSQQPNDEKSYSNNSSPTIPSTTQQPNDGNTAPASGKEPEPWVDPDNYEPNSIIGDRSTMYCYLPGQYPYSGIAPENVVYFDSLADAQAAGYRTHQ